MEREVIPPPTAPKATACRRTTALTDAFAKVHHMPLVDLLKFASIRMKRIYNAGFNL